MSTLLKNCQHTLNQPKNKNTFKQNISRQLIVFSKINQNTSFSQQHKSEKQSAIYHSFLSPKQRTHQQTIIPLIWSVNT